MYRCHRTHIIQHHLDIVIMINDSKSYCLQLSTLLAIFCQKIIAITIENKNKITVFISLISFYLNEMTMQKCNFTTIIEIRTGNNDYCLVSIHLRFYFVASLDDTHQVHCSNRNRRIWRGQIKRQIDKYSIKDPVFHQSRWSIFVWKFVHHLFGYFY